MKFLYDRLIDQRRWEATSAAALMALVGLASRVLAVRLSFLLAALAIAGGCLAFPPSLRRPRTWLTKLGGLFILFLFTTALAAFNSGLNMLYLMVSLMLGMVALSAVLVRLSLRGVTVTRYTPEEVYAGQPFEVSFEVRVSRRRLPTVALVIEDEIRRTEASGAQAAALKPRCAVVKLEPGKTCTVTSSVCLDRRGLYEFRGVRLSTKFPFGLFERWRVQAQPMTLVAYPAVGRMRAVDLTSRATSATNWNSHSTSHDGQEDFRGLHEFRPGDNPRLIHWKTSARLREWHVKELEGSALHNAVVLLDTRVPEDAAPTLAERLERGVSFAATVCSDLALHGYEVSFAAFTPELTVIPPGKGAPHLRRILEALALLQPSPDDDLPALVGATGWRWRDASTVIAIALSDRDAAWLSAALPGASILDVGGQRFEAAAELPPASETSALQRPYGEGIEQRL